MNPIDKQSPSLTALCLWLFTSHGKDTLSPLLFLISRLSYLPGPFPEHCLHLPPELQMRSPQRTLLPLRSSWGEAAHSARSQKLRSAFSLHLITTSKPYASTHPLKTISCFSCHLAISLKLTNCISFDTVIPFHTKILVQSERTYVRTSVMACNSTKKMEII